MADKAGENKPGDKVIVHLESQDASIEIDFGSHIASRETKLTECQVAAREAHDKHNEIHLSQPARPEHTLHLVDVTLSTAAQVLAMPFLHLAENSAINKDIANFIEHYRHDPNQLNRDATRLGGEILGIIDKPMSEEERARMVGMLIPLFFLPGANKPLDLGVVKSMRLEQMTEAQLAEQGITRRVVEVYRGDKAPYAPTNSYGRNKSYINEAGDLVPASPAGVFNGRPVDIVEHIKPTVDPRAKSFSPYTSFSESARHAVAGYGKSKITVNLEALRYDIKSGALQDVEIIDQANMARHIEKSKYGEMYKQSAFNDVRAEREVLIKGIIPKKYLTVGAK
ncbi:hypothetical protein BH11CYA1_BH11CYA1_41170 [soil metagenome]